MRHPALLALPLALLACRSDDRAARRPVARPRPQAALDASATPATPPAPTSVNTPIPDGGTGPSGQIHTFRLGESTCVRDAARAALSASATGFFSTNSLELEVRNIAFSCTPGPTFEASLVGATVHLRYQPAQRPALARCACRLDQFLQVSGIPAGDYELVVEEAVAGDAGSRAVATGRITAQSR